MPQKDKSQSGRERKHDKKNGGFDQKGKYSNKHIRIQLLQMEKSNNCKDMSKYIK